MIKYDSIIERKRYWCDLCKVETWILYEVNHLAMCGDCLEWVQNDEEAD